MKITRKELLKGLSGFVGISLAGASIACSDDLAIEKSKQRDAYKHAAEMYVDTTVNGSAAFIDNNGNHYFSIWPVGFLLIKHNDQFVKCLVELPAYVRRVVSDRYTPEVRQRLIDLLVDFCIKEDILSKVLTNSI